MRRAWKVKQENVGITSFTSDEALFFFVNSKHQYQVARSSAKQKNADIYILVTIIQRSERALFSQQGITHSH
jgi:hypothetical protein